jgi:hypothetical protein
MSGLEKPQRDSDTDTLATSQAANNNSAIEDNGKRFPDYLQATALSMSQEADHVTLNEVSR